MRRDISKIYIAAYSKGRPVEVIWKEKGMYAPPALRALTVLTTQGGDDRERILLQVLVEIAAEEPTVELSLPRNSNASRRQGLFTYSLCQALRQSTTTSYRELVQRVRGAYIAQARYTPVPSIEGTGVYLACAM